MKYAREYWDLVIGVLLLIISFALMTADIPWLLLVCAIIGTILIFIHPFRISAANLDIKSKFIYWSFIIVFFIAVPTVISFFISPLINTVKYVQDFCQGLMTASTVLLALAFVAAGIMNVLPPRQPLENRLLSLIKFCVFISLFFGFYTIIMLLRWFILGDNKSLQTAVTLFSVQISSTLITTIVFINLQKPESVRLRESGILNRFIRKKKGSWDHQDWLALLSQIRNSGYYSLSEDEIGSLLEQEKTISLTR